MHFPLRLTRRSIELGLWIQLRTLNNDLEIVSKTTEEPSHYASFHPFGEA
jgi:hypothetical protein